MRGVSRYTVSPAHRRSGPNQLNHSRAGAATTSMFYKLPLELVDIIFQLVSTDISVLAARSSLDEVFRQRWWLGSFLKLRFQPRSQAPETIAQDYLRRGSRRSKSARISDL